MGKVELPKKVAEQIVAATAATTLEEFATIAGVRDSEDVKELQTLFNLAEDYGYGDWLQFDASVVRGLSYYTGVVFEGFDKAGVLRAICGGGRYDRLLTLYGSPKEVPCCGFGFGDCVIIELLKEKGVIPSFPAKLDYVVAAWNADMMGKAMNVARRLRLAGKTVDVYMEPGKKVAKAFNYGDRVGADKVAFVAPDEWEKGLVAIKDLRIGQDASADMKQKNVPIDDLANVDSYFGGVPAPKAEAAAGPTAASKAAQGSGPPKVAATSSDGAPVAQGGNMEEFLKDYPYVGGFAPSAQDSDLYEKLRSSTGKPKTAAMARWYDHMGTFLHSERLSWR